MSKKKILKIADFINIKNLEKDIHNLSKRYLIAKPFPHIVIDNLLKKNCILNTIEGFKNVNWASYTHFNEKKKRE